MSTLHLVYMGQDNNTVYSVVINVAIKCMLCCVQLVHQVYCISSWTEPKPILNNNIPPTCLLKKALTINCNLTLPAWLNCVCVCLCMCLCVQRYRNTLKVVEANTKQLISMHCVCVLYVLCVCVCTCMRICVIHFITAYYSYQLHSLTSSCHCTYTLYIISLTHIRSVVP